MENVNGLASFEQVIMSKQALAELLENTAQEAILRFESKVDMVVDAAKRQFEDRIIDAAQVCEVACIGKTLLLEMTSQGKFPAKIKLSRTRIGWRRSDVQKWIAMGGADVWFDEYATEEQRTAEAERVAKAKH